MDYDLEIARMKETMETCLRSEQRLAEVQQHHSETLATLAKADAILGRIQLSALERIEHHEAWIKKAERDKAENEERWKHINITLAEIGDKLNGLIGYIDGQNRKQ